MTWSRSIGVTATAVAAFALASCATSRGGSIPYNVSNFGAPDAPKTQVVDDSYKLAPLDVVTVMVFQVPDLSRDYTVDQTGRITMPLIGRVEAAGSNTNELGTLIARRLDEKYLHDPNVTVTVKDAASRIVTVDGSVTTPGVYPLGGQLTLMQAISLARGTNDLANPHRVAIFRTIDGKRMAAAFDLTSIRRGTAPDPQIYPGDTVVVDGSGVKKAQRTILQSLPLASVFMAL